MSGLTQMGRLRILRDSAMGELPWRDGDGWLLELESCGWVERTHNGRFYHLTAPGWRLVGNKVSGGPHAS